MRRTGWEGVGVWFCPVSGCGGTVTVSLSFWKMGRDVRGERRKKGMGDAHLDAGPDHLVWVRKGNSDQLARPRRKNVLHVGLPAVSLPPHDPSPPPDALASRPLSSMPSPPWQTPPSSAPPAAA